LGVGLQTQPGLVFYRNLFLVESEMSTSYWMDKSTEHKVSVDVVIVGGGIAGLSTAFWLNKEDPSLKIAIVEKYELGDGATGRNAGFITCGSVEHFNRLVGKHGKQEAEEIWKFSEQNLHLLKEHIIQDKKNIVDFQEQGSFSLASTQTELAELKKSAEIMKTFKINVEEVAESDLQHSLGVQNFVGGIKYLDDASVHPLKLLNLIKQKLLASTNVISFYENAEVFAIESGNSGKIVKTKKAEFSCALVILATNGYSALLHSFFADKIFPTRGQVLATAPVPLFMEGPCYANFVLDYFRQLPSGEVIIGGFRQLQKDAEVGYSDQTTEVIQLALEKFIQEYIPALLNIKITHRWSGVMGFSVDGQPMLGCLPNDNEVFFLGGFTAHGLGLAFHTAKTLVDCIYNRSIPKFISAKRFTAHV
jgi:glycine/D-amino acid oxidase-like deaminating enzyme